MRWFSLIFVVAFTVSCLGVNSVYAQKPPFVPPEEEEYEEGEESEVPPPPPGEEWEEPSIPPPPPGEEREIPPEEEAPLEDLPIVIPDEWEIPQGTRVERPVGEKEFVPGVTAPYGAPPVESLAVGAAVLYVTGYGNTRAATWIGGNLDLYVMGQGSIRIVEYLWIRGRGWTFHDRTSLYNPGPSKWSKLWFFADTQGWHALRAYVGSAASNWVYIYVY